MTGGDFLIRGASSYAGETSLAGGEVRVSDDSAFGTGILSFNGGLLVGEDVALSNDVVFNTDSTVRADDQTTGGGVLELSGNLSDDGNARSLSVEGPGVVLLSGNANTYTGGTSVNSGVLAFGSSGAVPASGQIDFAGGSSIRADYAIDQGLLDAVSSTSSGAILLGADSGENLDFDSASLPDVTLGSSGDFEVSGDLTPHSTSGYRFGGGSGEMTVSSDLSGTTGLTVSDGPTVLLTGSNDYEGQTVAEDGAILVFGTGSAIPDTSMSIATAGVMVAEAGGYIGIASTSVMNPQDFIDRFDTANTDGSIGVAGSLSNLDLSGFSSTPGIGTSSAATLSGTFTPHSGDYVFSGGGGTMTVDVDLVDGMNARDLTVSDLTVVLGGTNTYSGTTTVDSGGVLEVDAPALLGSTSGITLDSSDATLLLKNADTVNTVSYVNTFSGPGNLQINSPAEDGTIELTGDLSGFERHPDDWFGHPPAFRFIVFNAANRCRPFRLRAA